MKGLTPNLNRKPLLPCLKIGPINSLDNTTINSHCKDQFTKGSLDLNVITSTQLASIINENQEMNILSQNGLAPVIMSDAQITEDFKDLMKGNIIINNDCSLVPIWNGTISKNSGEFTSQLKTFEETINNQYQDISTLKFRLRNQEKELDFIHTQLDNKLYNQHYDKLLSWKDSIQRSLAIDNLPMIDVKELIHNDLQIEIEEELRNLMDQLKAEEEADPGDEPDDISVMSVNKRNPKSKSQIQRQRNKSKKLIEGSFDRMFEKLKNVDFINPITLVSDEYITNENLITIELDDDDTNFPQDTKIIYNRDLKDKAGINLVTEKKWDNTNPPDTKYTKSKQRTEVDQRFECKINSKDFCQYSLKNNTEVLLNTIEIAQGKEFSESIEEELNDIVYIASFQQANLGGTQILQNKKVCYPIILQTDGTEDVLYNLSTLNEGCLNELGLHIISDDTSKFPKQKSNTLETQDKLVMSQSEFNMIKSMQQNDYDQSDTSNQNGKTDILSIFIKFYKTMTDLLNLDKSTFNSIQGQFISDDQIKNNLLQSILLQVTRKKSVRNAFDEITKIAKYNKSLSGVMIYAALGLLRSLMGMKALSEIGGLNLPEYIITNDEMKFLKFSSSLSVQGNAVFCCDLEDDINQSIRRQMTKILGNVLKKQSIRFLKINNLFDNGTTEEVLDFIEHSQQMETPDFNLLKNNATRNYETIADQVQNKTYNSESKISNETKLELDRIQVKPHAEVLQIGKNLLLLQVKVQILKDINLFHNIFSHQYSGLEGKGNNALSRILPEKEYDLIVSSPIQDVNLDVDSFIEKVKKMSQQNQQCIGDGQLKQSSKIKPTQIKDQSIEEISNFAKQLKGSKEKFQNFYESIENIMKKQNRLEDRKIQHQGVSDEERAQSKIFSMDNMIKETKKVVNVMRGKVKKGKNDSDSESDS